MATYKKSEATKAAILAAASELFYQKGYYATTIKDICSKTGVSVSRVNYHFLSKADLAEQICEKFLENFYFGVKDFIGNTREYSLLSETIQLRFFMQILLSDQDECPVFFHEIAKEGILSDAFIKIVAEEYRKMNNVFHHLDLNENRISIDARLYAGALHSIAYSQLHRPFSRDRESVMDAFAKLFMQIADIPHDVQTAILDKAKLYDRRIGFRLHSLTDIELFLLDPSGNPASD